jgi:hypothetical protein
MTKIRSSQGRGSTGYEPIVISGGNENDKISVTPNKAGGVNVTVTDPSGKSSTQSLTAEEASRLVIKGGGGNDKIYVDPKVKQGITIHGGAGNDRITGGSGKDRIYGDQGKDVIWGKKGDDFIDGGKGEDWIYGGRGKDTIKGGQGRDVIYGGSGKDSIADNRRTNWIADGDIKSVDDQNEGYGKKGKLVDVALGRKGDRDNKDWPMTVTVHGIDASPNTVAPLSIKAQKAGDSVKSFAYDDLYGGLDKKSKELSNELSKWLKDKNNDGRPLRIDAHSMGGRIALAALDDLNQKGLLKGRKVELNLVASAINGEDSARVKLARAVHRPLADVIPGVMPGKDMSPESEFQKRLNDIRFPSNVKVRVFTASEDDVVNVDSDFNRMVDKLNAEKVPLPGADHNTAIDAAAQWLDDHR